MSFLDSQTVSALQSLTNANGEPTYKASTIKTINDNIKTIFNKGLRLDTFSFDDLITKQQEIIKFIDSTKSYATYYCNIKAIFNALEQTNTDAYREYDKLCSSAINKQRSQRDLQPSTDDVPTRSELFDLLKRLKKQADETSTTYKDYRKFQIDYLVIALYYHHPALRPQDWAQMSLTDSTHTHYLDITSWTYKITDWKTKKHADDAKTVKIESFELQDIIILVKTRIGSDWLIPMITDLTKSMSPNTFTNYFKNLWQRYTKKAVSAKDMRVMDCSSEIDDGLTAEDRIERAKVRGHSPATALVSYSGASNILHPTLSLSVIPDENIPINIIDKIKMDIEKELALEQDDDEEIKLLEQLLEIKNRRAEKAKLKAQLLEKINSFE